MTKRSTSSNEWMFFHSEEIPHNCEYKQEHDDLYKICPGQSFFATLVRNFRGLFICSHRNPRAIRFFRSHACIDFERSRQLRLYYYMVHPFSYFRIVWEIIMILAMFYSIFVSLWAISFPFGESTMLFAKKLRILRRVTDVLCSVNIIINFRTGCVLNGSRRVELRFKSVAKHYLTGLFIIDFIGAIPATVIGRRLLGLDYNSKGLIATTFVTMGCRLIRTFPYMVNLFKVLNFTYEQKIYVLLVYGSFCYFHIMACFTYFIAYAFDNDMPGSWVHIMGIQYDAGKVRPQDMYAISLTRALENTLGLCFGFGPLNTEDQISTMAYSYIGAIFFLFLVGKTLQLMTAKTASRSGYSAMITQVQQYMDSRKLPARLQSRVLEFYHFRFQDSFFHEKAILKSVSRQLRQDYRYHQCCSLVEKVAFFQNLPTRLLVRIVTIMETDYFLRGETVIHPNSLGSAMYFVKSGTVAIYSQSGQEVCHLEDGSHFGEISLVLAHFRRVAKVVTIENCELYRLERNDFNAVMAPYPQYLARVRRTALERLQKTIILDTDQSKDMEQYVQSLTSHSSELSVNSEK